MASNRDDDRGINKEQSIKFYLEAFKEYIVGCLMADCLNVILEYTEFTVEQKARLKWQYEHKDSSQVVYKILDEIRTIESKRKYRALLNAVKDNQKVTLILTGKAIPTEDRNRKFLFEEGPMICNTLNVEQVLPYLLAKDIITERDCQKIRAKKSTHGNWSAATELLFCLPNRDVTWFSKLIGVLEESKHEHLAEKLKAKYRESRQREIPHELDRELHSLNILHTQDCPVPLAVVQGSRSVGPHVRNRKSERIPQSAPLFKTKTYAGPTGGSSGKAARSKPDSFHNGNSGRDYSDTKQWLMKQNIGRSWWPVFEGEFKKPYFQELLKFVETERQTYQFSVVPKPDEIFCWTNYCTLNEVKVILMAENPTGGHTGCNGLAFSTSPGHPVPRTLNNIFEEVQNDIEHFVLPKHGCLEGWARQGVLLLNSILTWRSVEGCGVPKNLHRDHGWEKFTDAVLAYLCKHTKHKLVFILLGNYIKKKAEDLQINEAFHCVLKAVHPSYLSANKGFFGCRHFSRCNKFLERDGQTPIDWCDLREESRY